ncbi:MAG: MFS transporter [Pseudoclavibacter sp.]
MTVGHSRKGLQATLIFLAVLSTSVASLGTPLLPAVQEHYGVSLSESQWALTITLLVGAVVTPVIGRLGSGPAHRATTIGVVAGMTVGCVLGALPAGFPVFLLGRAIQGLGLGLVPLALATARNDLPVERRASAIATIGVTTAVGIGIGYPVVGALAELGGVAAPFWFVAVLSSVCLAAVIRVLPATAAGQSRVGLVSSALLGAGLTLALVALSEGAEWGWGSVPVIMLAIVALALLAVWALWELRAAHPLIDLRMFRRPAVVSANVTVFLVAIGFYPLAPLVVCLVQAPKSTGYGFGATILTAGLLLLPFSLASFMASRLVRMLTRHLSYEIIVALGCLFPLSSYVVFLVARSTYPELIVAMALNGLGVGLVYAVNPLQIADGVPPAETSSAMSTYQLNRSVAYAVGSALSATFLIMATANGESFAQPSGYDGSAEFSIAVLALAFVASVAFALSARRRRRTASVASR